MSEIFKPIKDHPRYSVSNQGRVWSNITKKILKPWVMVSGGYYMVTLSRRKKLRVHRLVLEAFTGPCPVGQEVCHNDGNPVNNRLENLRYDTRENNQADRLDHGTHNRGEHQGASKLTESNIQAIRNDFRTPKVIAPDYNVSPATIYDILSQRTWSHAK